MLGLTVNYVPRTIQTLQQLLQPNANQPETIPWVLFDTQQYAQAGQTQLSFFTTLPNPLDNSITNMPLAGALPNPWFFEIQKLYFDVLGPASTSATQAGIADDIQKIVLSGRGYWTLTLSDKKYGQFPLSFMGGSGAAWAAIAGSGDAAGAAKTIEVASVRDNGGFPMNGALIIPPQTQMALTINWPALQAISTAVYCRVSMMGQLSRRVS